jgi:hypothetical protein
MQSSYTCINNIEAYKQRNEVVNISDKNMTNIKLINISKHSSSAHVTNAAIQEFIIQCEENGEVEYCTSSLFLFVPSP